MQLLGRGGQQRGCERVKVVCACPFYRMLGFFFGIWLLLFSLAFGLIKIEKVGSSAAAQPSSNHRTPKMLLANIVCVMSILIMALAVMFLAAAAIYALYGIQYMAAVAAEIREQNKKRRDADFEIKVIRSGFGRQRTSSWPL
jgi:hypothetical protein